MGNISDFKELKSFMASQPFDKRLESYKTRIYPLDKIGNHKGIDQHFYYILDWQTRTYPFISSTWKEIIDYDENFWEGGLDAVLSVIHPEDAPALQSMLKKWIEFIKNGTEESINKHSVSFDFRVIKKNGDVTNVLQQNLYRKTDTSDWEIIYSEDTTGAGHSFTDEKVRANTVYEYALESMDDDSLRSGKSAPLRLRMIDFEIRPSVKQFFAAKEDEEEGITLNWEYPYEGIHGFILFKSVNGSGFFTYKQFENDKATFRDTHTKPNTLYKYVLQVVYEDGNKSPFGKIVEIEY